MRGGCLGEADQTLYGGTEHAWLGEFPIVRDMNMESYAQSLEDERVQEKFEEYSSCMAERGYDRASPIEDLPSHISLETPEPSAAEIEMALRDVECQERVGVVDTWSEVERQIQLEMIDENSTVLVEIEKE